MRVYIKLVTLLSLIAFALIKKANFHLDPDNVGLFAGLVVGVFLAKYFSKLLKNSQYKIYLNNPLQFVQMSS